MSKNEQMSLIEAKRLSLLKWESIIKNGSIPTECSKLKFGCGFCERHSFQWPGDEEHYPYCEECEFGDIAGVCTSEEGVYLQYIRAESSIERILLVQKIINLIKQIEV